MKTSELLREGFDTLLVKGWGQGVGRSAPCARDVIILSSEAQGYIRRAIGVDSRHGSIPRWNDAPDRTFDEVCKAFLDAIKLAEADEAEQSGGASPVASPERPAPRLTPSGQGD